MEFKMNNKGFSLREFVLVLLIMAIVIIVVLNLFFKGNDSIPNKNFRNLAKDFSISATHLHDEDVRFTFRVFLADAIKLDYMDELTNPYNKKEKCDKYESVIKFDDNSRKKITIKCGNYLIFNEDGYDKVEDYKIYKVSKWSEKEATGSDVQTETFYNYSINGNMVLDRFMIEKEFLEEYSKKSGTNILSLTQVDEAKYKLEKKTFYRTLTEVD